MELANLSARISEQMPKLVQGDSCSVGARLSLSSLFHSNSNAKQPHLREPPVSQARHPCIPQHVRISRAVQNYSERRAAGPREGRSETSLPQGLSLQKPQPRENLAAAAQERALSVELRLHALALQGKAGSAQSCLSQRNLQQQRPAWELLFCFCFWRLGNPNQNW